MNPSNSRASRKLRASAVDAGRPLGAWLGERLGVGADAGAALCVAGGVYVDGRRVRDPARPVAAGERITVHTAPAPPAGFTVIHEDPDVLVVDKPAGVATQATRHAAGALDEQVAARYPGAVPLHRLDRDASGLVLFARTPAARARLQPLVSSDKLHREYTAVVAGVPAADTMVFDWSIGPDPADRRRMKARVSGGDAAFTAIHVMRRFINASVLRVTIKTGRTHQIRVHLLTAGHPIIGDSLYAPPPVGALAPRLCLHATRLEWPNGAAVSPLPADIAAVIARL